MVDKKKKADLVSKFGKKKSDTGSIAVQVAIFSESIDSINQHFRSHPKDYSSKVGLMKLVGRRKRFLNYLKSRDMNTYLSVVKELGLRV